MPLIHGYSRTSISKNIRLMRKEGRKQRQAIALALATARAAAKKAGASPAWLRGSRRRRQRVRHRKGR